MAPIASPEPLTATSEKKKKRKDKSEKKRAREEDEAADGHRKHKKSKSAVDERAPEVNPDETNLDKKEKKKKKKSKSADVAEDGGEVKAHVAEQPAAEPVKKEKKKKKHEEDTHIDDTKPEVQNEAVSEKKKKKKKSSKSEKVVEADTTEPAAELGLTPATEPEAMDIDVKSAKSANIYQPHDIPANPQFPFFTQTVSLYEPIYPSGWAEPNTSSQAQILRPLQNRYVPSLRGVLLDYRNVALGEQPGRAGAALDDETPTTLASRNEYAVGFGWITADVDMFVPSRGAWMEGSVNLQTEGHIGVVCFGKFNASIEASRLLPDWRWVSNDAPDAQGFEETRSVITADEHGVVRQIHSTGFWVDGDGERVTGKIRFRIRNFDVGASGPTSYLSLEGTMLDKAAEKALVKEEADKARSRKGLPRRGSKRRVPEFAMTRFEPETEQPQEATVEEPQAEVVKSSRPESEI